MLSLIIGGAGSGKSAFAESLCCGLDGRRIYLATMEVRDDESRARVRRHRAMRRTGQFETLECSRNLVRAALPERANVLLEDLSNLLANEMFLPGGGGEEAVREGLQELRKHSLHLTVVTNEVFSGGREYGSETVAYMHSLARLNRALAAEADLAVEIVCGLPNVLKGMIP